MGMCQGAYANIPIRIDATRQTLLHIMTGVARQMSAGDWAELRLCRPKALGAQHHRRVMTIGLLR
jgi:hypothetical protein